jgi:hypothetical protein
MNNVLTHMNAVLKIHKEKKETQTKHTKNNV